MGVSSRGYTLKSELLRKKDVACEQGEDDMGESRGKNMICRSRILDLSPSVAIVHTH